MEAVEKKRGVQVKFEPKFPLIDPELEYGVTN